MALGVPALLAAAAAGFFLLRRWRRTGTRRSEDYVPQLDDGSLAPKAHVPEYATSKPGWSEMPAREKVHEKDSTPVAKQTLGELEVPRY